MHGHVIFLVPAHSLARSSHSMTLCAVVWIPPTVQVSQTLQLQGRCMSGWSLERWMMECYGLQKMHRFRSRFFFRIHTRIGMWFSFGTAHSTWWVMYTTHDKVADTPPTGRQERSKEEGRLWGGLRANTVVWPTFASSCPPIVPPRRPAGGI